MKYCKECGNELEENDKFCEKCGTRTISGSPIRPNETKEKSKIEPSSSNKYVFPAIISFFLPGVGQFIKGQVKWGLTIWLWFWLGNCLIFILYGVIGFFSVILGIFFNFAFWIFQIWDAYNSPEDEQ